MDPNSSISERLNAGPRHSIWFAVFQDCVSFVCWVFEWSWGGIHPWRVEPASPKRNHGDVSWVVSTSSSQIPASLHLLALLLKLSLSGLRAPEHPLFTPSLLVLIQVTRRERKAWVWSAEACSLLCNFWTILWVSRCSIYYPVLTCRPIDTKSFVSVRLQLWMLTPWYKAYINLVYSVCCFTSVSSHVRTFTWH